MHNLFNTPATPETLVPARGLVRRLTHEGSTKLDYPEGSIPAHGEIRVLHNEAGGIVLLADRAGNPRLTGRVARLFATGELRLAGPAALIEFITTELATQWETSPAD